MRQPERQHNRKGVRETSNQKYEITDIAHENTPSSTVSALCGTLGRTSKLGIWAAL